MTLTGLTSQDQRRITADRANPSTVPPGQSVSFTLRSSIITGGVATQVIAWTTAEGGASESQRVTVTEPR